MKRFRAFAQLLRLPAVFTALADICLGWLAAQWERAQRPPLHTVDWLGPPVTLEIFGPAPVFWLLLGSSVCLYLAGMVLNDYFDIEEDRKARPERPLPSGQIPAFLAAVLGAGLLVGGVVLAFLCVRMTGWLTPLVALAVAALVLAYNYQLKDALLGPVVMGLCRFFNVLLGLTALGDRPEAWMLHVAAVVGVYITGVTWFARHEQGISRRGTLLLGVGVMGVAAFLAVLLLRHVPHPRLDVWEMGIYIGMLGLYGLVLLRPLLRTLYDPSPQNVQSTVTLFLRGVIIVDALLAFAVVGWPGLFILVLLLPNWLLGRWVYST
jgi:4-hydroxybenzoate polyprenyltransferase